MSDELLSHYNRELAFIRKMGGQFAAANPALAGALRLREDGSADPFVERMIEAFAYLNARTRRKIEDDFPEITDAMLSVLYPHYLAPVPSMAIAQFALDRSQGGLVKGHKIPRGSIIETDEVQGEVCHFRTCYPVQLWPFEVREASLGLLASAPSSKTRAAAVLRIGLKCFTKDTTFAKLEMPSLRFHLKGQPQHMNALYELLMREATDVILANGPKDPRPVVLGAQCLRPAGFAEDESLLPATPQSFAGYHLLTDLFALPEKFLFFDLTGLSPKVLESIGNQMEVFIYLNRSVEDIEQNISAESFRLGCAPVVNLFEKVAEPISLTQEQTEYRVVPDSRRSLGLEVYRVSEVIATNEQGDEVLLHPFYSFKHASATERDVFWYASRQPSVHQGKVRDGGTATFLSLADLAFRFAGSSKWTLAPRTICLNRDLPRHIRQGARLTLVGGGPLASLSFITQPTPTRRPAIRHGALWRLISHLSLNHLSLTGGPDGADALRELFTLHDFVDSTETRTKISGLLDISSRRVTRRAGASDINGGLCRGLQVTAVFDPTRFTDNSLFLYASVLERFLGLYCSINSFTELVVRSTQHQEDFHQWPPRAAHKALL